MHQVAPQRGFFNKQIFQRKKSSQDSFAEVTQFEQQSGREGGSMEKGWGGVEGRGVLKVTETNAGLSSVPKAGGWSLPPKSSNVIAMSQSTLFTMKQRCSDVFLSRWTPHAKDPLSNLKQFRILPSSVVQNTLLFYPKCHAGCQLKKQTCPSVSWISN